jgi:UDP-glucose 4,6-dehydratase
MQNILVTGGCGFIGSNFINFLHDAYPEYTIVNVDAMYYCADEENIRPHIRDSPRYKFVKGNICSHDLISHILHAYDVDCVVHFAAQSHVQDSFNDSLKYSNDNILGTHTLLEACRVYGKLHRFIHISTDEVYGESRLDDVEKKDEFSILCPTNPYAATKAGAELLANSYRYSFNMPIIITRGNNVYGPNQYPEKLIPRFIQLLKQDKKVTIQGDGSNVRAFLHVHDVASALDVILHKGIVGEIYNIGSDDHDEYTVDGIAKKLIHMVHNTTDYEQYVEYIADRPFNDKRYYISNAKVKDLGWNITVSFEKGLQELIEES